MLKTIGNPGKTFEGRDNRHSCLEPELRQPYTTHPHADGHFMESILHDGEPKAIQLVDINMKNLFEKLDRIITTTAFLLVLILMRKFCQPQQVWYKEG